LLYGSPHLFPFNITSKTWYTVDWHGLESAADLIAVSALQIRTMHMDRKKAVDQSSKLHIDAAEYYAKKHVHRLISGKYAPGELVLVALKGPNIVHGSNLPKSADRWAGPFKIAKRYISGSYQLQELDGTILKGSVPAGHLKPFYTREGQKIPLKRISNEEESDSDGQFNLSDGDDSYQPAEED